jgi:hypothetical protein
MKNNIALLILIGVFSITAAAQAKSDEPNTKVPANFVSDGCTKFPDGDYRDCCVEHDKAYYNGGTKAQRLKADNRLRACVGAKNGWWHKPVSLVMWSGVRIGGGGWTGTNFRWGYGHMPEDSKTADKEKTVVKTEAGPPDKGSKD